MKPTITVVGAAVVREGKLLALRRAKGSESVIHKFELVGGKVLEGEDPAAALKREIKEELMAESEIGDLISKITYEYPECTVILSAYLARLIGDYKVIEHEEEKWIPCSDIDPNDWAPADRSCLKLLKEGYVSFVRAQSERDFSQIFSVASSVMHETFSDSLPEGQVDYMIGKSLTPEAMRANGKKLDYSYKLVYLNGEVGGFFAHCPAKHISEKANGVFLSQLYLLPFARGKNICEKVVRSLAHPVYITVRKEDAATISMYKHIGFKIVDTLARDIGGGYMLDDFIMRLK